MLMLENFLKLWNPKVFTKCKLCLAGANVFFGVDDFVLSTKTISSKIKSILLYYKS